MKRKTPGAVGVRRLSRMVNGRNEKCVSATLLKKGGLSLFTKMGYVNYLVSAFVPRVLQCTNCKALGHVSCVCRKLDMSDHFAKIEEDYECWNCGGEHSHESPECPLRMKEAEIASLTAACLLCSAGKSSHT